MTRLVNDLLTLARADEGRLNLASDALALNQLVAEAVRDMDALAELHDIRITTDLAPVVVNGDADRLRQVVLILLDNAIRYSPAATTVDVTLTRGGKRAVLVIADEGPGMSLEQQRHVFDRFYRGDSARAAAQTDAGTGLGLAIAQTIVAAHRGTIAVRSQPGHGATFTVRIPSLPATSPATSSEG
jgi:signal transduction histidine kinase